MSKKNPLFIIITGVIIAIGRLYLGSNNIPKEAILIVMAIVNYVALGFVILFLSLDVDKYCYDKIDKAGIGTKEKSKRKEKRKFISSILSGILLLLYLGFGYFYISKLKSENMNDFISIIALSISIAANGLVSKLGVLYYDSIIKLLSKS